MILKFGASWCSSCLITKQNLHKLAAQYQEHNCLLPIQEIDVDSEAQKDLQLRQKYQISDEIVLPVLVFLSEDGAEFAHLNGGKRS